MDHVTDTPLVHAIQFEQFEKAKQLIRSGADVHAENYLGQPALHLAVTNMSTLDECKIIPEYTCFINNYKFESFKMAVSARDEEVIEAVNAQRKGKAYESAARLSLVKELLNAGAKVNHKDRHGCSPIQCAIYTADLELVKTLIDAGADVDNQNNTGATALHDAILCRNEAMVHLLLSRGASVNVKTERGVTPLHWATMLNMKNEHAAIIEELLEYPVDVNMGENGNGQTPFHHIVQLSDLNMVRRFIELGADITKADREGNTALHFSVVSEDVEVLNLVYEVFAGTANRISIDQMYGELGWTPLICASLAFKTDNVHFFIAKGADVNARSVSIHGLPTITPLHACVLGSIYRSSIPIAVDKNPIKMKQTINLLLESGADMNEIAFGNPETMTILQYTFDEEIADASNLILEHVARVEARTNKPVLNDYNRVMIDGNPKYSKFKTYYDECRNELQAMKNSKFQDSTVTYFAVLTEPVEVVARYMRNKNVVQEFETKNYQTAYPIYGSQLGSKFGDAVLKQKELETACSILSTTLQLGNPRDLFFETIFKYLSKADVHFLIDSSERHLTNHFKKCKI